MSGSDLDIFSELAKRAPAPDPTAGEDPNGLVPPPSALRASAPPAPPSLRPSAPRSSAVPPPPPSVKRNTLPGIMANSVAPPSVKPASRNSSVDLLSAGDPSEPLEVASFRWSSPPPSRQDAGADRQSQLPGSAQAPRSFAASTGSWAPAPPPGPMMGNTAPGFNPSASPFAAPATVSLPPQAPAEPRSNRAIIWVGLGVLVLGLAVAAVFVLRPTKGSLLITASGPQQEALTQLEVFVDGKSVCKASPCTVSDLTPGAHKVSATAPGYTAAAEQAVSIQAGNENAHHITLPAVAAKTGLRVLGNATLDLKVDGKQIGALPRDFIELAAGSHEIQISGGDNYQPYKDTLTLGSGETRVVGPVTLKVLKGKLSLTLGQGAEGAKVELDGQSITLPATLDLTADQPHQLTATKKGYEPFTESISFVDGHAERTIAINLVEAGKATAAVASAPIEAKAAPTAAHVAPPTRPDSKTTAPSTKPAEAAQPTAAAPAASGQATLNINSIPASSVLINGRPVGLTPKLGVSVSPGSITVTFIHPEQGRKTVTIDVPAGGTKTVTVRFP